MTSLPDPDTLKTAAERIRVFGQPQRLIILAALLGRELSVSAIAAETGIGQPALSQQLAEIRRASLVAQRRDAKQVLYRLIDERTASIVVFVISVLGRGEDPAKLPLASATARTTKRPLHSAAQFAIVDR